jgi:hypothetical protein
LFANLGVVEHRLRRRAILERNCEALWRKVHRFVSDFLTTNGAVVGETPDEVFRSI